jgi:sulfonate transport system substrate-binding protein
VAIVAIAIMAWFWRDIGGGESSGTGQALPVIRFGTLFRAIDYAPYYVAREKGWLDEALRGKAQVEHLATFQTPPSANEAMAANRADIVLTAGVPAIVARAAGVNLRLPMLSCTLSSQVVVRSDSPYEGLSDLEYQRFAVAFGTGPHYGLLRQLQKVDLAPPRVELLDMIPPDAKAAFQAKAVEAWAIFPPYIEQELLRGDGKVLEGVTSPVQVVVSVREELMQASPELVNIALDELKRAKAWLQENPDEAQRLLSELLDLPLEVVRLSWTRLDWSASIEHEDVKDDLQNKADFLVNEGFTKRAVDVRQTLLSWPES